MSKSLKLLGNEVRMVTPRYRTIRERRHGLREIARLRSLQIKVGNMEYECSIKSGFVTGSKVQVYFLENADLYDRPEPVRDFNRKGGESKSHINYALLSHAALQLMITLNWIPDIIHCNNWQTALTPYLLRQNDHYKEIFSRARSILHLHDIDNMGIISLKQAKEIGIEMEGMGPEHPLDYSNGISFLKGGFNTSDQIVAVSPTFASEIKSITDSECDLSQVINRRKSEIIGVLNGVDQEIWNPTTDRAIKCRYNSENLVECKMINKHILLQMMNLRSDIEMPLVAFINRLSDRRGLDLLIEAEEELISLPMRLVILGVREPKHKSIFKSWVEKYPDKVSVTSSSNIKLEHQIIAGADMLLMPSSNEPCGYHQMHALLYGTVPVVRKTGGLKDTVMDYDSSGNDGNGFTFDEFKCDDMINALTRAHNLYQDKQTWRKLQLQGMNSDFSWTDVAEKFEGLYREALKRSPHWD